MPSGFITSLTRATSAALSQLTKVMFRQDRRAHAQDPNPATLSNLIEGYATAKANLLEALEAGSTDLGRVHWDLRAAFFALRHALDSIPWWSRLTESEQQVALQLMRRTSSKEIADELRWSSAYVNNIRSGLRRKLGLPNGASLSRLLINDLERVQVRTTRRNGWFEEAPAPLQVLGQILKRVKAQGASFPADSIAILQALGQLDNLVPRLQDPGLGMRIKGVDENQFSLLEWHVIVLIAKGYDTEAIARILGFSVSRVYKLRGAIRERLGLEEGVSLSQFIRLRAQSTRP